jgi:sulfur relay (sulfurtransferase) complex TusBCD TusD component (DsrE family)
VYLVVTTKTSLHISNPGLPGFFIAHPISMTTLSLLVKNEPAITSAALRFAKACSNTDAGTRCVFFYGKGVLHATGREKQFWSEWSRTVGARLVLCSASAETFGLTADDDFSVEGLGELMEAGLLSGKVVSFG